MKIILWISTCLVGLYAALPEGGVVTAGAATIASDGPNMTINQATEHASIDWQKFNVGPGNKVEFKQPSTSSVTINRVIGKELSTIAGHITANGKFVLINPNGVVFSNNSVIDVEGIVVSTHHMNEAHSSANNYHLQSTNSKIVHDGTINSRGEVMLLSDHVEGSGAINADGRVVLAADPGSEGLSLAHSEHLTFTVDKTLMPTDGSTVAVSTLVASSINCSVKIKANHEASSMSSNGAGEVVLCADKVKFSGKIDNSGGNAHIAGEDVSLEGATIDVSAKKTGQNAGNINVGGDYQGQRLNNRENSRKVTVDKKTKLMADSKDGDGGNVIMWSEAATFFAGHASAESNGARSKAGLIEVSSKGKLRFDGRALVSAASGRHGRVLLDPGTITITANFVEADDGLVPGGVVNAVDPNILFISTAELMAFGPGNLTLQADDLIDLSAAGILNIPAGVNLSLITINPGSTLNAANVMITLQGGSSLTITTVGGAILSNLLASGNSTVTVNGPTNNGALPLTVTTDTGATILGDVTTANQPITITSTGGAPITVGNANAGTNPGATITLDTTGVIVHGLLTQFVAPPLPPSSPSSDPFFSQFFSQFSQLSEQVLEAFGDSNLTFQRIANDIAKFGGGSNAGGAFGTSFGGGPFMPLPLPVSRSSDVSNDSTNVEAQNLFAIGDADKDIVVADDPFIARILGGGRRLEDHLNISEAKDTNLHGIALTPELKDTDRIEGTGISTPDVNDVLVKTWFESEE